MWGHKQRQENCNAIVFILIFFKARFSIEWLCWLYCKDVLSVYTSAAHFNLVHLAHASHLACLDVCKP